MSFKKNDSGITLTVLAAVTAIVASVIIGHLDIIPKLYMNFALSVASVLTGASGILTIFGSSKQESENKKELEKQYKESTNRIDKLHANYNSDIKEAFGLISKRTVDEFLAEKTPRHMSQDKCEELIEKALNKWINENFKTHSGDNMRIVVRPGYWNKGDWITVRRNVPTQAQSMQIYWDAYASWEGPPIEHRYIHVIINSGKPSAIYNDLNSLTEKAKELYYKYGRWYDEYRIPYQTHQQFQHVVIIVSDDELEINSNLVKSEIYFWVGHIVNKPSLKLDQQCQIVTYTTSSLKDIKVVFR